jgi:hypothetical protein
MKLEDYQVLTILRDRGIFDMWRANLVALKKKALHDEIRLKIPCVNTIHLDFGDIYVEECGNTSVGVLSQRVKIYTFGCISDRIKLYHRFPIHSCMNLLSNIPAWSLEEYCQKHCL